MIEMRIPGGDQLARLLELARPMIDPGTTGWRRLPSNSRSVRPAVKRASAAAPPASLSGGMTDLGGR